MKPDNEVNIGIDNQISRSARQVMGNLLERAARPAILLGRHFEIPSKEGRGQTIVNICCAGVLVLMSSPVAILVAGVALDIYNDGPSKRECKEILEVLPDDKRTGVVIRYKRMDEEIIQLDLGKVGGYSCQGNTVNAADYLWMPAGPPTRTFGPFKP